MSGENIPPVEDEQPRKVFRAILSAAMNNELCLVPCTDRVTRKQVYVICSVSNDENGVFELTPLARQFDNDPYNEIQPPVPGMNSMRIH